MVILELSMPTTRNSPDFYANNGKPAHYTLETRKPQSLKNRRALVPTGFKAPAGPRKMIQRALSTQTEIIQTSFFNFASAPNRLTSSLIFCACDLSASSTASSVCTRMESRRPTTAMGVRRFLLRAS